MTKYNEIETEKLGKILTMQCHFRKCEEAHGYPYQEIFDNLRKTQALLKKGANPNGKYPDGCNFLEKVIECQDYDIFKQLVKAGVKLQSSNNVPLLYKAVSAVTNQNGFNILKFLCDEGCTLKGLTAADKLSCIQWNENYIFTGFWYGDFKGKYCHGDGGDVLFASTLLMIRKGILRINPSTIAYFEHFLSTEEMFSDGNRRLNAMEKAHKSYLASQKSEKTAHQKQIKGISHHPPKGLQRARSSEKQID